MTPESAAAAPVSPATGTAASAGSVQLGVVGLGVMGSAIATRLLHQVGSLAVHDLRPEAVVTLSAVGAKACAGPAELAAGCDVVVLSLNSAEIVGEVVFGATGLATGLAAAPRDGAELLVIDMSSTDPAATRDLAERAAAHGIRWVDAPLSGGAPKALRGELTLMVGGADDDVAAVRPVLELLAKRITHLGPAGSGQVVKLVNQVLVAAGFAALAEAAALVRAAGLPADHVLAALTGGRADSALLQEFFVKFATGDLSPTGRIGNMVKDLDAALAHARGLDLALPITSQVADLHRWLCGRGWADADSAALMGYYDPTLLPGGRP